MGMAKVSTAITGFENFAAREYPRLVAALTLLVRDRGVAEELAQDALVRTYGPWVHRVAVNGGVSWLRRRSAERRALRRNGPAVAEPWDDAEVLAVRRAVSNLPRRQRQAIVYRYYFGYSTAETAELMGIRPGSLKSAVTRAFATLRAELDTASHVTSLGVPHE
jgi:RNA polymerase sigma factor (sigma-70 family)